MLSGRQIATSGGAYPIRRSSRSFVPVGKLQVPLAGRIFRSSRKALSACIRAHTNTENGYANGLRRNADVGVAVVQGTIRARTRLSPRHMYHLNFLGALGSRP